MTDPAFGYEHGWKVHDSLNDWVGKVDSKASIVLTLETAILGLIIAFSDTKEALGGLYGQRLLRYRGAIALLVVGILVAGMVVMPQLNRWRSRKSNKAENLIYFGHLRHWKEEDLASRLDDLQPDASNDFLARQLVSMSKIAWRKHAWLQWSLLFTALGCALMASAVFGR